MKFFRCFIPALLTALLITSAPAQDAEIRIATVDMQKLFKQYHRTVEARKQLNADQARVRKDASERQATIRDLQEQLETLNKQLQDTTVSLTKKQELDKDFQFKRQRAVELERELREFIQLRDRALKEKLVQRMSGILEEIRKLVEQRAKQDDYDYVFDSSGQSTSQVPVLLYAKDAADITAELLEILNKDAPEGFDPSEASSEADQPAE